MPPEESSDQEEIFEPEVLPPEEEPTGPERPNPLGRLEAAFGPLAAGIVIDTLDLATWGRLGFMLGLVVGGSAAFWMCSMYRMPVWQRFLWALAAGIYCTTPRTEFIPLATLIGAFARFRNAGVRNR